MKEFQKITSACRYCRYYQPEGRRGGKCQRLGAHVLSHWRACNLALPPFAPSWESLENAWNLTEPIQLVPVSTNLEKSLSIDTDLASTTLTSGSNSNTFSAIAE